MTKQEKNKLVLMIKNIKEDISKLELIRLNRVYTDVEKTVFKENLNKAKIKYITLLEVYLELRAGD